MTIARGELVSCEEVGVYHCISRCVRRAYLCGYDSFSGKSFEHRRVWIRNRLSFLVELFSVEVVAYAILSNHLHSLLRLRPDVSKSWSAREVARRWRKLFPVERDPYGNAIEPTEAQIRAIADDAEKVELYRERLSSLSWFHRCLNEKIARSANREDGCTGRFWEGRFKSQRVYDVGAVLACAAYIDLNPIRAEMAKTLEGSDHTSVQDRIHSRERHRPRRCEKWAEVPLVRVEDFTQGMLNEDTYITLVEQTSKAQRVGGGNIPENMFPILRRLQLNPDAWIDTTKHFKRRFKLVVGSLEALHQAAQKAGKHWYQGQQSARECFC